MNDISYEALRVALMVEKCATEMKALMTPNDVIEIIGEAREWGAGVTSLGMFVFIQGVGSFTDKLSQMFISSCMCRRSRRASF